MSSSYTTAVMTLAVSGATQKSQWSSQHCDVSPTTATPNERAGLIDVLVMGMLMQCARKTVMPMASGAISFCSVV